MTNEMKDKICLVTGATSGIGFVTALELAQKGATVVVCGREQEKAANVVIKIRSQSNNPNVDFLLADLSDFKEVRNLAEEFIKAYPKLDVLVNNAGAIFKEFDLNPQRVEKTMALNHFSIFLLTGLLLDTLKASAPSRIINVSSMLHKNGSNNFNDLNNETNYKGLAAYNNSKLALLHFTYELARRLNGGTVTVNAMHPGWVKSNFGNEYKTGVYGIVDTLFKPIQLTSEQGAQTIIYLASSPDIENISGKYFVKKNAINSSDSSYNEAVSKQLWQLSEELTNFKWPDNIGFNTISEIKKTPSIPKQDDGKNS